MVAFPGVLICPYIGLHNARFFMLSFAPVFPCSGNTPQALKNAVFCSSIPKIVVFGTIPFFCCVKCCFSISGVIVFCCVIGFRLVRKIQITTQAGQQGDFPRVTLTVFLALV